MGNFVRVIFPTQPHGFERYILIGRLHSLRYIIVHGRWWWAAQHSGAHGDSAHVAEDAVAHGPLRLE